MRSQGRIYSSNARTKAAAKLAFYAFIESYALKYAKAVNRLSQDRDPLLAFYDFLAEHWKNNLRTTNPIERLDGFASSTDPSN